MSNRITEKQLLAAMNVMAMVMGVPQGNAGQRDDTGKLRAVVGALVLNPGSQLYGNAWIVSQMVNEAGGERTLIRARTARELFDAMYIWREGFEAGSKRP